MKNKYTHHLIELVAWLAFILFPLFLFPTVQPYVSHGYLNPALKGVIMTHSLLIVFYYFNFYYAIPKFYFAEKKGIYALIVLSCLTALILLLQTDPRYNPLPSPPFRYATFTFILSIIVRFVMVMLFSLGLANIQRLKQTEKEKIQTELSYLKAQINPHFLFNTLNSIYALTVKKSEAAPESVTKLSAIMRYVMSEATAETVSLEKEIAYISSYIELERLRLTARVRLEYSVQGDPAGKQIAPLIFIPLVENAFKHGVSTSQESSIEIRIVLRDNELNVFVKNSKVKTDSSKKNGLGLENIRRRLRLLYPSKHELKITETEQDFSANLVLVLND